MISYTFDENRAFLLSQLDNISWAKETGPDDETLSAQLRVIAEGGESRMLIRAKVFSHILSQARLSVDRRSLYTGIMAHQNWMYHLRGIWRSEIDRGELSELIRIHEPAMRGHAYDGNADFSHVAPDWARLLRLGFPGVLEEVRSARAAANGINDELYQACEIVCEAILTYLRRLEALARRMSMDEFADRCAALAEHAPQTLPQAYQVIEMMYLLLTYVEGENLRSLGRLDQLLAPLYRSDLESGRYTREELAEYTRHFFAKLHAFHFSANAAFVLGGVNPDGTDTVNEFSFFVIEVYRSMNIYDPKMQIRVSDSTPPAFLREVLRCIRDGMNSFVFINDNIAIPAMQKLGASLEEARNYLLIGCYEPSINGNELPCTCNGTINLAKVVEAALNDGIDPVSGARLGPSTGTPDSFSSFDMFMEAVRTQYRSFADGAIAMTNAYERTYPRLNPAPLLSALLPETLVRGADVYAGGVKYNNSSINSIGLATAVDSLAAIRKFVYEEHVVTLPELAEILRSNWAGSELLRRRCLVQAPKFGNADPQADNLAKELTELISDTINGRANGRGGRYRSGLFSIDWNLSYGRDTGATADGRLKGDPLSKNLCAGIGRDKSGVTALIRSNAVIDFSNVPNGSVLDVTLHPSVVRGEKGLDVLESMLHTYCDLGCFGIHINILDAAQLRAAQKNPEQYASLQVRVCGWNAYFVNLNETEQNQFILRAEALEA